MPTQFGHQRRDAVQRHIGTQHVGAQAGHGLALDVGHAAFQQIETDAVLLAQAAPLMLLLFLVFPRAAGPLWALPLDARAGLTGLSDAMTPGNISSLIQSDALAFRAAFDGPVPSGGQLYWRGPVFNRFDGRTWSGGERFPLCRGVLKASHRAVDEKRSKPGRPWHPLTREAQKPVEPGKIEEYAIEIMATANLFRKGHRICIEITTLDMPTGVGGATNAEYIPNHIGSAKTTVAKIFHDTKRPSHLLLPVRPRG